MDVRTCTKTKIGIAIGGSTTDDNESYSRRHRYRCRCHAAVISASGRMIRDGIAQRGRQDDQKESQLNDVPKTKSLMSITVAHSMYYE